VWKAATFRRQKSSNSVPYFSVDDTLMGSSSYSSKLLASPGPVQRGMYGASTCQQSLTFTPTINPLMGTGDYSATSNNMKFVHWPLMGGLLHLVERGGDWAGPQPAQSPPRCTKCNDPPINGQCTNHRIMVRCSAVFSVLMKGLSKPHTWRDKRFTSWHAIWRANEGRTRDSVRGDASQVK